MIMEGVKLLIFGEELSGFCPSAEGVVAFGFVGKRNPEVSKCLGPSS
jgi:hypothetical protein